MNYLTHDENQQLVEALTELEELSNKHAQLSDELEQIAIRRQENEAIIKSLLGKLGFWSWHCTPRPVRRETHDSK
jgi:predicted transcriptional regulator